MICVSSASFAAAWNAAACGGDAYHASLRLRDAIIQGTGGGCRDVRPARLPRQAARATRHAAMDVEETRQWHVSTGRAGGLAKRCEGDVETHDMRLIRVICRRVECRRLWGRRISCVSTATRCLSIVIVETCHAGDLPKRCVSTATRRFRQGCACTSRPFFLSLRNT